MSSSLILSWNELATVKESVKRLLEDEIEVWVVDNGSTDGTQEWLEAQRIHTIQLEENMGAAYARNRVIERFGGEYLLMLDGDIVYIPGSYKALEKALPTLKDAYCLGIHNNRWDGTKDMEEADASWPGYGMIRSNFAIAWTQYGLFKGDLIRKYPFPEVGPFSKAGYGYEDDWMNAEMESHGYKSYHCTKPLYYHDAHKTSQIMGEKWKLETEAPRKKLFKQTFPNYKHWTERI